MMVLVRRAAATVRRRKGPVRRGSHRSHQGGAARRDEGRGDARVRLAAAAAGTRRGRGARRRGRVLVRRRRVHGGGRDDRRPGRRRPRRRREDPVAGTARPAAPGNDARRTARPRDEPRGSWRTSPAVVSPCSPWPRVPRISRAQSLDAVSSMRTPPATAPPWRLPTPPGASSPPVGCASLSRRWATTPSHPRGSRCWSPRTAPSCAPRRAARAVPGLPRRPTGDGPAGTRAWDHPLDR